MNLLGMKASEALFVWPMLPRQLIRAVTCVVPLIVLAIVALQPWEDPKLIFLDALVAAEVATECCSFAYGFMSQLSILIWVTAAGICLFAGLFMMLSAYPRHLIYFAISAGILTGWLGIDDAFLVHEKVLPSLGVPQTLVLATYVVLTFIYLLSSWRVLRESDFLILFIGGAAFAVSLGIDIVLHAPSWVQLEDSAKFFGICCWASFHIVTLLKILTTNPASVK